jgi:hypothetical protein
MGLLFSERGGGSIGWTASGTWPFAELEIYSDKIIFTMFWFKKAVIPLQYVKYVEKLGVGIAGVGQSNYLEIEGPDLPSSITFAGFGHTDEIDTILKRVCPNLQPPRPWHENPLNRLSLLTFPFAIIVMMGLILNWF